VDRAAHSLVEISLHEGQPCPFLHLENPIRQSMQDIATIMARELRLPTPSGIPFIQWLEKCKEIDSLGSLETFFTEHFRDLAHGAVVLDTKKSRSISRSLRGVSGISKDLLIKYIARWRLEEFI
jgi:hypothetical protein